MAKLLALFNILAGTASIAGLYLTMVTKAGNNVPEVATYDHRVLLLLFIVTLGFCAYVLFVPGNRIERNVGAKLKHFRYPQSGDTVAFQEDEFTYKSGAMLPIQFPHPFAAPPTIELIKIGGHPNFELKVIKVTPHHFEIECTCEIYSAHGPDRYRWIAKGKLLDEVIRK
jgi:hypothetical protein